MPGEPDPVYVAARRALLDALGAARDQLDAIVLVGAQAIYLHTGDADVTVAPYTTDADIALDPRLLQDDPLLESVMASAGFASDTVGRWTRPVSVSGWREKPGDSRQRW